MTPSSLHRKYGIEELDSRHISTYMYRPNTSFQYFLQTIHDHEGQIPVIARVAGVWVDTALRCAALCAHCIRIQASPSAIRWEKLFILHIIFTVAAHCVSSSIMEQPTLQQPSFLSQNTAKQGHSSHSHIATSQACNGQYNYHF